MIGEPVRYSDHSEDHLVSQRIGREVPEHIIRPAEQTFTDTATGLSNRRHNRCLAWYESFGDGRFRGN
jgi:hypothetical protein